MKSSAPWTIRFCFSMLLTGVVTYAIPAIATAADGDSTRLATDLRPMLTCLAGKHEAFTLTGEITTKLSGKPQQAGLKFVRYGKDSFDFELVHDDYAVQVRRRANATAMALPLHNKVYLGIGDVDANDNLAPAGSPYRLFSPNSMFSIYSPLLQSSDAKSISQLLIGLMKVRYDATESVWKVGDALDVEFVDEGRTVELANRDHGIKLTLSEMVAAPPAVDDWTGLKVVSLERREIERQLTRGLRRAFDILAPSVLLRSPLQYAKKVDHGELRWIGGQRVVLLDGTPQQMGQAHGELLKGEALSCIDSVLYTFGTFQTIRTGKWFRHDLHEAYARLAPHIPERHKVETRAMAVSLGIPPDVAEALNVFPELFHCSGFAVFGKATKDGKLYHGRVLDYMTTIGLQDSATTFIVSPEGKIPFANVGYAGFIGSVSGMNARSISLGEMGGRGEGQWDGAPMATLMRRALEECSTLDQVKQLWQTSPRTCEYYYVFADGKTNQAVGCAATPQSVQFVNPGEGHELLGKGIPDVVVLSAGSRLEKLRQRVVEQYGRIDAEVGQWLMSRPVAMQSNLHNVLFVPQDGVFYVSNADSKSPAADRPYVRFDLNELLSSPLPKATTAAGKVKTPVER